MKWSRAMLVAALTLILPGQALALSCMQPNLDEAAIQGAAVIFEGTVGEKRGLAAAEEAAVRNHAVESLGGGAADLKVYSFTVTRGWKAAAAGETRQVLFNSHWGDGFAAGERYLVVSPERVGNLDWAPLCGLSLHVNHATDLGMLDTLERVLGD